MQIVAHRVALSITMLEACAMTARQRAVSNVVWTIEFARLSTFSHRIDTNVALSSQTRLPSPEWFLCAQYPLAIVSLEAHSTVIVDRLETVLQ